MFTKTKIKGQRFIMLATGGNQTVEIFDVQESTDPPACQLPKFPMDLKDAVAKIFDNTVWICGGSLDQTGFSDQCFTLDIANNRASWKSRLDSSMKQSRSQPAAALIQNEANNATVNMIVKLQVQIRLKRDAIIIRNSFATPFFKPCPR